MSLLNWLGTMTSTTTQLCPVLFVVFGLLVSTAGGISEFHVDTSSGRIVDSRGRERIFHGLNVVMKASPWHPRTDIFDPQLSFADADIDNLREWGFNVVRLAVMWPGVEPQRGKVNQTYIQIMQSIVQKLHSAGISTLIEFHQDLFSSRFCGEGVPSWVLDNTNYGDLGKAGEMYDTRPTSREEGSDVSSCEREVEETGTNHNLMSTPFVSHFMEWQRSKDVSEIGYLHRDNMHQSRDFVESFPEPLSGRWPIEPDQPGDHSQQQPSEEQCEKHPWAYYYFSYAVSRAFQSLYENKWGWADLFATYWKIVATSFCDQPGILGYELINEPWAGDMYHNPFLLLPGVADHHNLAPFYEKLQMAIRSVDPDHMLFMETVTFEDVRCGFSVVPGGEQFQNRTVLSYHYYQPPNFISRQAFRERLRESKRLRCGAMLTEFFVADQADTQTRNSWFNEKFSFWNKLRRLPTDRHVEGMVALEEEVSEVDAQIKKSTYEDSISSLVYQRPESNDLDDTMMFTSNVRVMEQREAPEKAKYPEDFSSSVNLIPLCGKQTKEMSTTLGTRDSVDEVLAEADAHLQSWMGWEYKAFQLKTGSVVEQSLFTSDGDLNLLLAKKLARTYPQAVMGSIISFSFDPTSSDFCLAYIAAELQGEGSTGSNLREEIQTQVFVHRPFYYPSGLDISVNLDCIKVQESDSMILLSHSQVCVGLRIYLRISKRDTQTS